MLYDPAGVLLPELRCLQRRRVINENPIDFLICPRTKKKLILDWERNIVLSEDHSITYPIVDGIIDFCPKEADSMFGAYDSVASAYDAFLTNSNALTLLYNAIVWGLRDKDYTPDLLSQFPVASNQVILDVPVGTGIFTEQLYKEVSQKSLIVVIDYSMGMIKKAQERYENENINNVIYIRGDISDLPIADSSVDILLSMNGFHAFPDKSRALSEFVRVIKRNGVLLSCFYIKGKRFLTDLFINLVYTRQGVFTPPYYRDQDIKEMFGRYFQFEDYRTLKSILWFKGLKK